MKPEKIMESNVLDIIFENRNKDYGAYELRSNYNKRFGKALGITALVVLAFGLMQSFKVPHKIGKVYPDGPIVILGSIPQVKEEVKKEEKQKHKASNVKQLKQFAQRQFTDPVIVENPPTPVASITELDHNIIGTNTVAGIDTQGGDPAPPSDGSGTSVVGKGNEKAEEAVDNTPIMIAQIMPQFPGGQEAFIKFMQKNLRQPEDFEEGQKMKVVASFVVDAEGNIVNIEISQNGRKDLDAEVIRVIKKMPKWNPGMQNGRKVAVYFKVPVTFVAGE